MIDNTENYFDDDALESIDRFETMLKTNKPNTVLRILRINDGVYIRAPVKIKLPR